MKIVKHNPESVEGTVLIGGIECKFEAAQTGEITIYSAMRFKGNPGFAVLASVEELEASGVAIFGKGAAPVVASPPVAAAAAAPAAEPAKKPAAAKKPAPAKEPAAAPVPAPTPPAPPAPAADEEDASAYIDKGTPGADSGDAPPPPAPPSAPKAPKAPPAAAPAPAAPPAPPPGPTATGTEPYVDPARPEDMPEALWNMTVWSELGPAFVQWMFERKGYEPGITLEAATEDVVGEALKLLPIMPIAKGAKPQTFSFNVLKTMLGKHVRALLANMQ